MKSLYRRRPQLLRAAVALGVVIASFVFFALTGVGADTFHRLLPKGEQIRIALHPCLRGSSTSERSLCFWEIAPKLLSAHGVAAVFAAFEEEIARRGETSACHDAAHVFGVLLYERVGLPNALASCTPACHQGCQHGAVGAALQHEDRWRDAAAKGRELPSVTELVELCDASTDSRNAFHLCLHGLGHAFMIIRNGDVLASLKDCDALGLPVTNGLCWTGVFMENARNTAGAGHQEAFLRDDDPLYPCTMPQLDEKYLRSCYHQVPVRWDQDGFAACRRAPPRWREDCAEGLGIGIAAARAGFADVIIRNCSGGLDLRIPCLRGAHIYLQLGEAGQVPGEDSLVRRYCSALGSDARIVCPALQN